MTSITLSHLRTILWLRWRLTRNQWERTGAVNAVIMFAAMVAGLVVAAIGSIAGLLGGLLGLSHAPPEATMAVFDVLILVFLFMWTLGLITELQRSETLDLNRFLHLPVVLRDVFLINYLASLLCLSTIVVVPGMVGLALGLTLGSGPAMLLLVPLMIGFFFMITAWTYCLRGWLAALMVNKRRRQAIIMGVTLTFILVTQLPNLAMNFWIRPGLAKPLKTEAEVEQWMAQQQRSHEKMEAAFSTAHNVVPLLWLANGAKGLADGHVWPALWGSLGMMGIGAWGFSRAYRGTVRFYQGSNNSKLAPVAVAKERTVATKKTLVERRVPFVPEPAGAMAMAALRSMSRAPEVKMALTVNVVMFAVMGGAVLMRIGDAPFDIRPFVASAAVGLTFMGLTQLLFNHFGFDRNGFRAIALLPTPRHLILLGKNLALITLALILFSFFLVMVTAIAHLRFLDVLAAGFEFATVLLLMCTAGNLASIMVPYRVSPGGMKRSKMSGLTALLVFLSHSLSIVAITPALIPPLLGMLIGSISPLSAPLATLLCAATFALLASLLYWQTLTPLGRLLERRQSKILETVTVEVE